MTEPKRFQPNSIALTIAGSDPSGGAGIQADLKTFQQIGVYGASVVTLLTAQNTMGVRRVETMPPDLVIDQIDAVLDDLKPVAAKTGALGNADIIEAVTERAERERAIAGGMICSHNTQWITHCNIQKKVDQSQISV